MKSIWLITIALLLLPMQSNSHKENDLALTLIEQHIKIASLNEEVNTLKQTLVTLEESYNKNLYVKSHTDLNLNIVSQLREALKCMQGPKATVTSLKRNHTPKSKHYVGKAVDFRYDVNLIKWLESEEGDGWLYEYDLRYIVEFPSLGRAYRNAKKRYKNVVLNPFASGKHIHVEIVTTRKRS